MTSGPNPDPTLPSSIPAWFLTMITACLLTYVVWVGQGFLIPLAITALLFILASALFDKCSQIRPFGREMPTWAAHVVSLGVVMGAMVLFGSILATSADDVQAALPKYEARLTALTAKAETYLGPELVAALEGAVAEMDIAEWLGAFASGFAGTISTVGLVLLYLAFLISERSSWTQKLPYLVATDVGVARTRKIVTRISDGVKQYMWVNAVTSAMSGAVAFVIFSWIELDFAPLLALVVFLAGFIPNIGAFIGIALPALVALIQFDTLTPFLIVVFGYGAADQFIANVVQPAMQGRSLNMSTFMVMVSLTFWATVWGGIGAFLAVPMMVVVMVICAEIPQARWITVLLSADGHLPGEETDAEDEAPAPSGRTAKKSELDQEIAQLRYDFDHRDD